MTSITPTERQNYAERAQLRRRDRLRSARDFRRVQRTGRRRAGAGLVVQVAPARAGARPGLGLSVSRRVGNAVVRNRVKRRLREWFRKNRAALLPGVDLVVIARGQAAHYDSAQFARELSSLLAQPARRRSTGERGC